MWIGFAGILCLMVFIAVDSGRMLRSVAATSDTLRRESRERDALLDQLRSDIYHSGTNVRDYLVETDDAGAASQKAELESVRTRIDDTLRRYEQTFPENRRGAFQELHTHVNSYWQSLAPALEWDAVARRKLGAEYLRSVILPRRAEIVELARQVTLLNERDLDSGEDRLRALETQFRRRVTIISVVALLIGGILASVIIHRMRHLEQEAETRYREVEEARRELRKLSDRLVTAQEEERRNLSRELHDEVGQAMTAMLVDLGRLEAAPPDGAVLRERLGSTRRLAETCVGMVRNMALLLRPSMLDDLGLIPALRWQAREVTRRTGLPVKMVADDIADDLLDSHRTCLYRFVQEALNNCARHSRASQVRVVVREDADGLSVSVQDNGIGFDPRQEKGMGLLGMEERVARLGGRLRVESQPGHGTLISMHFRTANCQPAPSMHSAQVDKI
ncbi:MAG: MCP four helix bundle domain-containing protein [Acidobacteriia bacterium]|nr:MCP four helix bundle domain-containing protein [Terriglobia bacterium]